MESISRISSILETARDLTLEAAQNASNARGFRPSNTVNSALPLSSLKKLLDSRHERDVLEGLRKVIAMLYRPSSPPTSPLFSSVIKNIASPNPTIKKLVYIYLLHHSESQPDLALLSINTIQKSLSDSNPHIRALALRVMSGIRVPVISQIVSLGIKKGAGDMSAYVRKAAALAIPKCYKLDPATKPQLEEYIATLLGDRQYFVVGAAVMAFLDVCPEALHLVHKHYRGLIRKLVDMDEWGQLAVLRLMVDYARRCFPRRVTRGNNSTRQGFYEDGASEESTGDGEEIVVLDPDLRLLLDACKPLLQSKNSAVVVSVARCYLYLGTPTYIELSIGPLISLLRSAQDIQHIALYNIVVVCLAHPLPFTKYATHFLVRTNDTPQIWRLKLEVLTLIFPHSSTHIREVILCELEYFSRSSDPALVRESVRAIGRCSQSDPRTSLRCLRLLLKQISSQDGTLVAESLTVIRHLIQQDPTAHTKTVIRLAKNLDTATNPQARASIIWLVAEFAGAGGEHNIAPDVLRILAKGFAEESEPTKLQIILLAAKVYCHHLNRLNATKSSPTALESPINTQAHPPSSPTVTPSDAQKPPDPIPALWTYILLLARYDTSYDLRDRARLYASLLSIPSSTHLASLLLLAPKPSPHIPSPSETRRNFLLGSASLVIGTDAGVLGLPGYTPLPEWVEKGREPPPGLREEGGGAAGREELGNLEKGGMTVREALRPGSTAAAARGGRESENGAGGTAKHVSLDDWLAESSGQEEEEEEEGESASEEEMTEEEEEEEDDESEDEDLIGREPEAQRLVT
ncbi:MAG: AP-3 complex subunit beta [Vezdaea acicularis]|nr:MAG: AP-3 complex subunit beta [Vezdaea acicularis]